MATKIKGVFALFVLLFAIGFVRGDGELYKAADYVQTGLIAQWDSIENGGPGVQDTTLTTWKNLTSIANRDFVFPYGPVMETDEHGVTYYNLSTDADGHDHACLVESFPEFMTSLMKDPTATQLEIVFDVVKPAKATDSSFITYVSKGDATVANRRIFWIRSGGTTTANFQPVSSFDYFLTSSYTQAGYFDNAIGSIRTYSFQFSENVACMYPNGSATAGTANSAKKGAIPPYDYNLMALAIGACRKENTTALANANPMNEIKLYAVRVYDHCLSPEERASNYQIDQARFVEGRFLLADRTISVESDVVGVGDSYPAIGMSVLDGDSITCTNITTFVDGGVTYTCAGAQLYTNQGGDWVPWGDFRAGNIVNVTGISEKTNVKVVWHWEVATDTPLTIAFESVISAGGLIAAGTELAWARYAITGDFPTSTAFKPHVAIRYGISATALDTIDGLGSVVSASGAYTEKFPIAANPDQKYFGQVVLLLGDSVVAESAVFDFTLKCRLASWSFGSGCNVANGADGNHIIYADESGNGYDLSYYTKNVTLIGDVSAAGGSYSQFKRTEKGVAAQTTNTLELSYVDGVTFFARMRNVARNAGEVIIPFETSNNYQSNPRSIYFNFTNSGGLIHACAGIRSQGSLEMWGQTAAVDNANITSQLDTDDWVNVVVVFDRYVAPSGFTVYLDGVPYLIQYTGGGHTTGFADYPLIDYPFYLGSHNDDTYSAFDLDEFYIYAYPMNEDEVKALSNSIGGVKDGDLVIEKTDVGECVLDPAQTTGYADGQVVKFSCKDDSGMARKWSLYTYDEKLDAWQILMSGFGHEGSFTHNGGKMKLKWDFDDSVEQINKNPICDWRFDDVADDGKNNGTLGRSAELSYGNLGGLATPIEDGILKCRVGYSTYAQTTNTVDLSAASGLTIGGWVKLTANVAVPNLFASVGHASRPGGFRIGYNPTLAYPWEVDIKHAVSGGQYCYCHYKQDSDVFEIKEGEEDSGWHYVMCVIRKGEWPMADIYIDGKPLTDINPNAIGHALNDDNFPIAQFIMNEGVNNSRGNYYDDVTIHTNAFTESAALAYYLKSIDEKAGEVGFEDLARPDDQSTIQFTVKKGSEMPYDAPIPGFNAETKCETGATYNLDFTGAYHVEGKPGNYRFASWTKYKYVNGEWVVVDAGTSKNIEFTHDGGYYRFELEFSLVGMAIIFR